MRKLRFDASVTVLSTSDTVTCVATSTCPAGIENGSNDPSGFRCVLDAAVSNGSEINNHSYTLESAYLTWQSGNLFPGLDFNAVEIGGGNQNYQVFDGLLFWDGGRTTETGAAICLPPGRRSEKRESCASTSQIPCSRAYI